MDVKNNGRDARCRKSWWKRRTALEKALLAFLALLLPISIICVSLRAADAKNPEITSKHCPPTNYVRTVDQILQHVDFGVDPCVDFHGFTCNANTAQFAPKPTDLLRNSMRELMERPVAENDTRYVALMKSFYQVCITADEKDHIYLQWLIKQVGGWPVVEGNAWNGHEFTWISNVYKFMSHGLLFQIFFEIGLESDSILYLQEPTQHPLDAKLKNGFADDYTRDYLNFLINFAVIFGADRERANREMKDVVHLEIELSKISSVTKTQDSTIHRIASLQDLYPYVPWSQYIHEIFHANNQRIPSDKIIVRSEEYFRQLKRILTRTSNRTLANYMFWTILRDHMYTITSWNPQLIFQYKRLTKPGKSEITYSIREECLGKILTYLDVAAGALYTKQFFNDSFRPVVLEIAENIRTEFVKTIRSTKFLQIEAQEILSKMTKNLVFQIAYPGDRFQSYEETVNKYYQDLIILTSQIQNDLNLKRFLYGKKFQKRDKRFHTLTTEFYKNNNTAVVLFIPSTWLRTPYFQKDAPAFMNYASIGASVEEEIIKTLQNQILICDQEDLNQCPGNDSRDKIINFLDKMLSPQVRFGVTYSAYTRISNNKQLSGLNYDPRRMFWIRVGIDACDFERKFHSKNQYLFKDFNCSSGL